MFEGINWIAVIVAGVIYSVIGALWYSPLLFSKVFMRYRGATMEELEAQPGTKYIAPALGGLLIAFLLAFLIRTTGADELLEGFGIGMIGYGFALLAGISYHTFSGPHNMLLVLDAGYQFVAFTLMSILLTVWL